MALALTLGFITLNGPKAEALSCPSASIANPSDILVVTYYVTSSSCTTSDPGSGVLLSATIDDNFAKVTFQPGSSVVASSITTGAGCTESFSTTSGNVAAYKYGSSAICSISVTLADGGSLSFVATNAPDGLANSFTSVDFVPPGLPSWTLAATPSPTSFSAAGQNIAYSYTLKNTGNVTINSIALSGTKTGTITCLASTLAPGASTTCSSTYTTVAGDLGADILFTATAKGTPAGGTLADATTNGSITFTAQPLWTLAATPSPTSFSGAGQNIAYSYTLKNTGNVTINSIAIAGTKTGAISCPVSSLKAGESTTCSSTYATVAGDLGADIPFTATAKGTPAGGTLADATTNGSITFTAQPLWTLAATPSPTSFNAAGQNIAYNYTLKNTGNVTINSIALSGTKTGTITCLASTLAAGASTTCSSTYTTIAGDLGADIPFTATAKGTPAGGILADATTNGSISFVAQPALTLATTPSPTTYSKVGEPITFTYKVTNAGNVVISSITVADTKTSGITCLATTLGLGATTTCSGTYSITAADILAGSVSSSATAQGMYGTTPVASQPVPTTLQLDADAIRQATQDAIRGFMHRRAEVLTSSEPDHGRKHERLNGWLFGGGDQDDEAAAPDKAGRGRRADAPPVDDASERSRARSAAAIGVTGSSETGRHSATLPFGFSGGADDGFGRFAFATSLSKMQQSAQSQQQAARERDGLESPMGLGGPDRAPGSRNSVASKLDIWTEGMVSYYNDSALGPKQQGHAAVVYVGADYRVHPAVIIGALVQFDWISETASALSASASGQGWMAGPYASVRLTRNLFFDARAAWGRSDNRIDPFGIYTDSFETERGLAAAKLTGNWSYGQIKLRPSAEIIYFRETQQAYTNQLNILIPEQSISLGRLVAGPEIGYQFRSHDGITFEPYVGIKGVWDFAKTGDPAIAGVVVGDDPFHAKLEIGAIYNDPSGASLRGSFAYDGIGDGSFRAYHGRAQVTIPFN